MRILSASKSAAMAASNAQVNGQSWRSFSRLLSAVLTMHWTSRCQDDVLTTNEMANYLQACGSAVLAMRTAGQHKKSLPETEIQFISEVSKYSIGL